MKKVLCAFLLSFEMCYAMPAQVMIIRHAERNTITFELTGAGVERAQALGSYFTQINDSASPGWQGAAGLTNVTLFNYGQPCALYAPRTPLSNIPGAPPPTTLPIQTMIPTAFMLNLPLHTPYAPGEELELAQSILNNPQYDGKNVLICWDSEVIPSLIQAFGYQCPYTGDTYPQTRFDFVWVMTFPAPFPPVMLTPVLQELLYGDSNTP